MGSRPSAATRPARRGLSIPPLNFGAGALLLYYALPLAALLTFLSPRIAWDRLGTSMALRALALTLGTTAVATLLCVVLGVPVAWVLARHRFPGHGALEVLSELPITIPPVAAGVALLLAFGRNGLIGRTLALAGIQLSFTTLAVVMAQVFIASPFFVKAARAGFESVDPALERAALTLGAPPWHVFLTVTLPLARQSLAAGAVLAWARSLSEFGATMMFAGNYPGRTQTLALAVMSAMESDLATAVAISALTLGLAVAALIVARVLAKRWSVPLA